MRKIAFMAFLAITVILAASCSKDDDNETTTASFSAKVNGTAWSPSFIGAVYYKTSNFMTITAGSAQTSMISLQFYGKTTGTYLMNNDTVPTVGMYSSFSTNEGVTTFFSESPVGEIKITKFDLTNKLLGGTFSFVGEDIEGNTLTISEGKFSNVPIQVIGE